MSEFLLSVISNQLKLSLNLSNPVKFLAIFSNQLTSFKTLYNACINFGILEMIELSKFLL